MSVTIRLSRTGRKHKPAYRVVVANTRDKRDGKPIEILGHYNPSEIPVKLEINKEKVEEWRNKGALVTAAVEKLLAGTYEFKPYIGAKALKAQEAAAKAAGENATQPTDAADTAETEAQPEENTAEDAPQE